MTPIQGNSWGKTCVFLRRCPLFLGVLVRICVVDLSHCLAYYVKKPSLEEDLRCGKRVTALFFYTMINFSYTQQSSPQRKLVLLEGVFSVQYPRLPVHIWSHCWRVLSDGGVSQHRPQQRTKIWKLDDHCWPSTRPQSLLQ